MKENVALIEAGGTKYISFNPVPKKKKKTTQRIKFGPRVVDVVVFSYTFEEAHLYSFPAHLLSRCGEIMNICGQYVVQGHHLLVSIIQILNLRSLP